LRCTLGCPIIDLVRDDDDRRVPEARVGEGAPHANGYDYIRAVLSEEVTSGPSISADWPED